LSAPNRRKITTALSKLKFLVVMDPLQTETARFWENYGEHNDVDPSKIQTEVIELPTPASPKRTGRWSIPGAGCNGTGQGGTPPGEAKHDNWIMAQIFLRLRALYQKEGGTVPEPIVNLDWRYKDPGDPTPEELAKELNGYANEDITDPNDPTKVVIAKGKQLVNFSVLRDDGKNILRLLDLLRLLQRGGQQHGPPRQTDPDNTGVFPNWAWSWPLNRRIIYNRASADVDGNPGIRAASCCGGTAASGPDTTFPTSRRMPSPMSSARSS
jgi:formate dehydrogenase major subunit